MYMSLSSCDFLAGVAAILNVFTLFSLQHNENITKFYIIPFSTFLTSITSHTSVFYNTVLVVVRTINMLHPGYKVNNIMLKLVFILYPAFWVPFIVFDIKQPYQECNMAQCNLTDLMCEKDVTENLVLDYSQITGILIYSCPPQYRRPPNTAALPIPPAIFKSQTRVL